ncbi:DUF1479 domain-containing protein [Salinisphaera sp. USBA-960]|uniref:DUF1479 domain-containing protein n=1 Tax=Salinisphaera orenii TaxID=856731 RepID=UPI000DBE27A6|nr:DUF1479 domain-containing protein [Salifodinibacter halophilus]NNC26604.1 DUF1479 domain-containing protein [Salifodinibacter halophilus]
MNAPLSVFDATLPDNLEGRIVELKRELRARIGDVDDAFARVSDFVAEEVENIEATRARGEEVWPIVDYADLAAGRVDSEQIDYIRRRGCAVIRGHFEHEQAREWDRQLVEYVDTNGFDSQYQGPADDFFGGLDATRPQIFPVFWSRPQMEARQDPRMATVQSFMNQLWKYRSEEGRDWFDPHQDSLYPDRVRRRPPGTNSGGLGAHTDGGAIERWLHPGYQKVFRHIFNGDFDQYDPWDGAWRTDVHEYESSTMCSAFRTFQGWTALSDMQRDQGVLHTVPIPSAMAYVLLRPLLDDVPENSLCGATPRRALPINDTWHPLLTRALSSIPDLSAGDSVWWHCDMIHSVAPVENQQGWGNVMYIPCAPMCDKNAAYATRIAKAFREGNSPDDFPAEHYEANWSNRFTEDELNDIGRQGLCLGGAGNRSGDAIYNSG